MYSQAVGSMKSGVVLFVTVFFDHARICFLLIFLILIRIFLGIVSLKATHLTISALLYQQVPALVLYLRFVVIYIYLSNGSGIFLNQPLNIFAWIEAAGVMLVVCQRLPK
ncbi:hypothetical protein [Serratia rubidaea]|uniref:hypothetical protein n=1 Tax=Serratia rubidaea TaxID=61652 RepID=UPI0022B91B93|nr:hypothetical protein [Serratia rubidaea]WBF46998.1 hypothetical protein OLD77_08110 [Serratia rubidaea]